MKEKTSVTDLVISEKHKMGLLEIETGEVWGETQRIYISRNGTEPLNFHDFKNLSNTHNLAIWVHSGKKKMKELRVPAKIKATIIEYLKLQSEDKLHDIDCFAFANMLEEMPIAERREDGKIQGTHLDDWEPAKNRTTMKAGDIFFLWGTTDTAIQFKHAAVYIGHDLYLSVYGLGGELCASTLEDMMGAFNANSYTKMVPIRVEK